MQLLKPLVIIAACAMAASAAFAQSSPNGTPGAVPGQGPGGNGSQSGAGTSMDKSTSGTQAPIPGSVGADPSSPANTTGQPAGDKPAQ